MERTKDYDFLFSCNSFFRNPKLKALNFDLALISHEVSLDDYEFLTYLENNPNMLIGFEHSDKRKIRDINTFVDNTAAGVFLYLTRYFSRLGFASRAMILGALFGAQKVDVVGFDGFTSTTVKHAFESGKQAPPFLDFVEFKHQAIIFWDYLLTNKAFIHCEFNNLGEDRSCNAYAGLENFIRSIL